MSKLVAIILGIIVIFLVYYLYITYFQLNILLKYADLNVTNIDINVSAIDNPVSTRYAYGVWIYVNTWSKNVNVEKKWIYQLKNLANELVGGLYLDQDTATLKFDIKSGAITKTNIITDNFPIQKWTNVIVSVDNNIIDFYIDGRLVLSKNYSKDTTPIVVFNVPNGNIGIGDASYQSDTFIARLRRWSEQIDPQTAWNSYLLGPGVSTNAQIGVDLAVLKNNIPKTQIKLY